MNTLPEYGATRKSSVVIPWGATACRRGTRSANSCSPPCRARACTSSSWPRGVSPDRCARLRRRSERQARANRELREAANDDSRHAGEREAGARRMPRTGRLCRRPRELRCGGVTRPVIRAPHRDWLTVVRVAVQHHIPCANALDRLGAWGATAIARPQSPPDQPQEGADQRFDARILDDIMARSSSDFDSAATMHCSSSSTSTLDLHSRTDARVERVTDLHRRRARPAPTRGSRAPRSASISGGLASSSSHALDTAIRALVRLDAEAAGGAWIPRPA